MLRIAFAEFRRRGLKGAGLGVDVQNETGALRIYERAGMSVMRHNGIFEKRYA
jgi:ribosomal protein S18 acetylase RimI-like enzyme